MAKEKIFISYKQKDYARVIKIKEEIEREVGTPCWLDLDGIETDAQFVNVIMKAINECEIFLFMYSKRHSEIKDFDNDWTAKEINFAQKKHKRIVFVNIDNTPLSDYFEFSFGLKQQVDYNDPRRRKNLYTDLRKWCGTGDVKPEQKEQPTSTLKEQLKHKEQVLTQSIVTKMHTPKPQPKGCLRYAVLAIAVVICIVLGVTLLKGCGGDVEDEHEYVDLGLSVKWATCNVGADSPEDYGDYFAWGETTAKSEYTEETSVTYGNAGIGDIAGNAKYDAARANWGGSWRLPTCAEIEELLDGCTHERTTQNGVEGRRFTSKKNGNSIFLPAAGRRYGSSLSNAGEYGYYWSATPYWGDSYCHSAYSLFFSSSWEYRYFGYSVRPVTE